MGQKIVIEILSDDSDDLDIDVDSQSCRQLGAAKVDKQPLDLSGAVSKGNEPCSPPPTISIASCGSTESPSPPGQESCITQTGTDKYQKPRPASDPSQTVRNTYERPNSTQGANLFQTNIDDPHGHPSSASKVLVEDSSSDEPDLRQCLKVARKAKALNAPSKHFTPIPTSPAVPSAPLLSAGIQSVFGNQVKRLDELFRPNQPQSPKSQAEALPKDVTPEDGHISSKRKAPYDPFAVHLLNIEPQGDDDGRVKKKKRLDKSRERSLILTGSQTPHSPPQHAPNHTTTSMISQDPDGQCVDAPGFVETRRIANGASKKRHPLVHLPSRPRATSVGHVYVTPERRRSNFEQPVASKNPEPTTLFLTPIGHRPSRTVDEADQHQRTIINVDEDHDKIQTPFATQAPEAPDAQLIRTTGQSNGKKLTSVNGNPQASAPTFFGDQIVTAYSTRDCSGIGILSHVTRPRRSPATHRLRLNDDVHVSQEQTNDLQGYIGGRPEKLPAYARKGPSSWRQVVKRAESRQGESGLVGKRTTLPKHPSRQPRPRPDPDADAQKRLLGAQEASGWREVPPSSAQTAFQNGNAKSKGSHSQREARTQPQPLFRPKQNAYHQPTCEDTEDDDDSHVAAPTRYSTLVSGSQAHRMYRPQPQPSLRPNNSSIAQPTYNDDDDVAEPQRPSANKISSKTRPQTQPLAQQMPRSIPNHIQSRPKAPRPQPKMVTREDFDRAEADMKALMNRHMEKHQAMIVDELPQGFGVIEPLDIRRAREGIIRKTSKINKDSELAEERRKAKRINERTRRIRKDVREKFCHKSQEAQEEEIQKRIAKYLAGQQAEHMQPKDNQYVSSATFNATFLENGHNNVEAQDGQNVDLSARKIPAYEAVKTLGRNISVDKYTVLLSEPHDVENRASQFSATKAFWQLEQANYYATMILDYQRPQNTSRKPKKTRNSFMDVIFGKVNGLLWGRGKLSSGEGQWVTVMVHKEAQMIGDLTPGALQNLYVDEEILDKYARDVYEVILINTVPKCFQEARFTEQKTLEIRKRQEERGLERKQKREMRAKERPERPAVEMNEMPTSLEGDELRRELANLRPPGTYRADAVGEDADNEESCCDSAPQASEDDCSSEGTVCSSSATCEPYGRALRNPFADFDHQYTPLGCFTQLREANKTALSAARASWAPRNANIDAHYIWTKTILPYLAEEEKLMMEVDDEELHLIFPGFDSTGGPLPDHRPWGFTHSQLRVVKRELQGPVDLGLDYVQELHDVHNVTSSFDRVIEHVEKAEAKAAAQAEAGSKEQGAEVVELPDGDPSHRESTEEGDYSEEE